MRLQGERDLGFSAQLNQSAFHTALLTFTMTLLSPDAQGVHLKLALHLLIQDMYCGT